jgi:hypothetical protein
MYSTSSVDAPLRRKKCHTIAVVEEAAWDYDIAGALYVPRLYRHVDSRPPPRCDAATWWICRPRRTSDSSPKAPSIRPCGSIDAKAA